MSKNIFLIILVVVFMPLFAQAQNNNRVLSIEDGEKLETPYRTSGAREEIQRYMGYETLPVRYISLPYDMTMNTNFRNAHIDVTFWLFLFIPLLFLLGVNNEWWYNLTIMGSMLFVLAISVPTGYASRHKLEISEVSDHIAKQLATGETSFLETILLKVYSIFTVIGTPFYNLFASLSGSNDVITYPLLLLLFAAGAFLLLYRIKHHTIPTKIILLATAFYGVLYFIFSAGIAWYGMPFIALGFIFIVGGVAKENKLFMFKQILIGLLAVAWLGMAFSYRAANYDTNELDRLPKRLIFPVVIDYMAGNTPETHLFNSFFPRYDKALNRINSEDTSLIYRSGTFFPYFIKKSDARVLTDDQLVRFVGYRQQFPKKEQLAKAFKASGYKYIIAALSYHTIDKTPEQSLIKKSKIFLEFLKNNPNLQLISTDRIISSENGLKNYGVFGKVMYPGTFAVYEIK